jgi:CIC family chloride channel protein
MASRRSQIGKLPNSLRRLGQNDQVILSLLAAVIGAAVAYAAYFFRVLIAAVQWGAYGFPDEKTVAGFAALPWWQILFWPTAAGLCVGVVLKFAMPGGRSGGPADVIEANALANAQMIVRAGLLSSLVSAVSLGAGASAGREGIRMPSNAGNRLAICATGSWNKSGN